MIRRLFEILLVVVIGSFQVEAQVVVQNEMKHFTVTFHGQWDTIPNLRMVRYVKEKGMDKMGVSFETGFYKKSNKDFFDYPYGIIQFLPSEHDLSQAKFRDLVQGVQAMQSAQMLAIDSLKELNGVFKRFNSYKILSTAVDSANYEIRCTIEANVADKGDIRIFQKYIPVRQGIILLSAYTNKSDNNTLQNDFQGIIKEIAIEHDYKYIPPIERKTGIGWKQLGISLSIGLLVFMIVYFWERLFPASKKSISAG